jgi:hypothetical protein
MNFEAGTCFGGKSWTLTPKTLLKRFCRESGEAVYRVGGAVKSLEEMFYPCEFQSRRCVRWDCRKFDIAVPLHSLFQASQQHLDSGSVELLQFRTIEHHARPICVQARLHFAKESTAMFNTQRLR